MKTVKLMITEFINNIKSNMITSVLISILSLILIIFVSIYSFQVEKYEPFRKLGIKKGFYVMQNMSQTDYSYMSGVVNSYSLRKGQGMDRDGKLDYSLIGYDKWIYENWSCRVIEGQWFDKKIIKEYEAKDELPVVIGGNLFNHVVGDVLELCDSNEYKGDGTEKYIKMRIIGIIGDDTGIIGDAGYYKADECSYDSLYYVCDMLATKMGHGEDDSYITGMVVVLPNELGTKRELYLNRAGKIFVEFDKNISEQKEEELYSKMYQQCEGYGTTYEVFRRTSLDKLNQVILAYVPYIVVAGLVLFFSIYTLSYISVQDSLRRLTVYMIVGASKKRNLLILLGNSIGTLLISFILLVTEIFVYRSYCIKHELIFQLNKSCVGIVVLLYILFLVTMFTCMFLAFRKKTTRGMLISLHK